MSKPSLTQSPVAVRAQCGAAVLLSFALGLCLLPQAQAAPPAGYYDTVDASSAASLAVTLHDVIDDHTRYPYTSSSTDTWDILELADEDPNDTGRILDVYRNASYAKVGGGTGSYNREHSWPKSYGFPNDNSSNYPYTDCHHLFLSDIAYNSSRSNKPFRDCDATCSEKVTDFNDGVGGGSGVYPGNSNWTSGALTAGTWETWIDRRGDVARAMFYLDLRYEGGTHGGTGVSEPDLILTDDEGLIAASNTGSNESVGYMGVLTVLLQWHIEDPVDGKEQDRNDVVFSYQGNRNPFIDHPEWVACLFDGVCSGCTIDADCDDGLFCNGAETCSAGSCLAGSDPCPGQACDEVADACVPTSGDPWINEFHYDNTSGDVGEFVEIAGPAGLDLGGWQVIGYNGNGGGTYKTVNLSGSIPDQGGCRGTLDFTFTSMQNGSPDGLALVDPTSTVVEFISYEGSFTATDGPAGGMTSVNIGVSEPTSSPVGFSLQLSGTGAAGADFSWQSPAAETPGLPNNGQSFDGCAGGCTVDADCDDGVFCNGAEVCVSGSCEAGTAVNCDDGVGCTDDACNEATDACDNLANDANCDDSLFCNGAETCDPDFDCQAGTAVDCDDGVACTDDACNEATDACDNLANDGLCDDGDACTDDTCDGLGCVNAPLSPCCGDGACEAGEDCETCPADCISGSGGDSCGNGVCEPSLGEDCQSCGADCAGVQGGRPGNRYCCGDGDGQNPADCNDSRCTTGGFDCSDVPVGGGDPYCCGDGTCEGDETEANCAVDCTVTCIFDSDCDDGDGCTTDTCSGGACSNTPVDCDDGDVCTIDACSGGTCFNDPDPCDDGDPCTIDSCDPGNGCAHTPDPGCACGGSGTACSSNADCCSNKCKGNGTCQ